MREAHRTKEEEVGGALTQNREGLPSGSRELLSEAATKFLTCSSMVMFHARRILGSVNLLIGFLKSSLEVVCALGRATRAGAWRLPVAPGWQPKAVCLPYQELVLLSPVRQVPLGLSQRTRTSSRFV